MALWNHFSIFLILFLSFLHLLTVYTLFGPPLPPHPPAPGRTCSTFLFSYFLEKIIKVNKNMASFVGWDKDSYTGRFHVLFPCICALQPKLVPLYQTSSLLPSPLPTVASDSLKLQYSFLYSEHINHIQGFDFLPFPCPTCVWSLLSVWPTSNNNTAFVLCL
jgi:hypothetical protein